MENSIYQLHTNYYITVVLCHKSHVDFSIIIKPVRLAAKCVDTNKKEKKKKRSSSTRDSLFGEVKGTGSQFSTCSLTKILFFCRDMLYHLRKQYDHVIMLSKNQSAHSPGSHLINSGANSSINFSAILVLLHPTSGYSEIHFFFEIHSQIAGIHLSGIINW